MAMTFGELEREYEKLWGAYEEGTLHSEDFSQALAQMRVEDSEGQWWQIKWNGKWMRYNGHDWEEASRPKSPPPPPPLAALVPPPRLALHPTEDFSHEDFSIFARTGVPAQQIPGLLDDRPASAGFLLDLKPSAQVAARPLSVEVQPRPVQREPSRPGTPKSAPPAVLGANTCSQCHQKLVVGAHFCRYCGTPVQDVKVASVKAANSACAKCHHPLPAGAKFCRECGHPVGS